MTYTIAPMAETETTMMDESRYADIVTEFAKAGTVDMGRLRSALIDRYVASQLRRAVIEDLGEEGLYAEIPGLRGLWADGDTVDAVRVELEDALRSWLNVKIAHCDGDIPQVDQINLNVFS